MVLGIISELERYWDLRDKRIDGWLFMSIPGLGLTLMMCAGYYCLVRIILPRFMANRPAYQLRGVMMAYNLFQIVFNTWLFYEIAMSGWLTGRYNFLCQSVNNSGMDEEARRIIRFGWWGLISRFIDYMDTIFFVLRKKDKQVTFLHVYHHSTVPLIIWPSIRYLSGGNTTFPALLNTLIHVIMYFYYFVAGLGPEYQWLIWWKKYLTTMQIVQFILMLAHCLQHLLGSNPCNFPKLYSAWTAFHAFVFLVLFLNYYFRTYNRKGKDTSKSSPQDHIANGKPVKKTQ